jgi:hypothetical protein
MFGRQNFGSPFQNPFQFSTPGYPFQQFTGGINPLALGGGFGGISPLISPIAGLSQINPFQASHLGGIAPAINPMVVAQLAATNPLLLSALTQQGGYSQFANPIGAGINSPWQAAVGAGYPAGFSHTITNPTLANDPITATLLTQQLNPLAQQSLPIRSLVGAQPYESFQTGYPGIGGSAFGQATDPYSALLQAQACSPLALSQINPLLRAYGSTPWNTGFGIPSLTGQVFPYAQASNPFCF